MHRCGFEIDAAAMTENQDTKDSVNTAQLRPQNNVGLRFQLVESHSSVVGLVSTLELICLYWLFDLAQLTMVMCCSTYATATRARLTRSKTWFASISDSVLDIHKKDDDSSHINCDPTPE